MRFILESLEEASTTDEKWIRQGAFQEAMQSIVGLAVAMHRGDRPEDGELTAFRQRVVDLMDRVNNRGNLGAYLSSGTAYAGRALQPGA